MFRMGTRLTPTVITDLKGFGQVLRLLRTMAGWSQARAGREYGCVGGMVSLREQGKRQLGIIDATRILLKHNYVLVVMHVDDMADIPRVRIGEPTDG